MKILVSFDNVWSVMGLLMLFFFTFTSSYSRQIEIMEARDYPSITYSYDRRDEVKKECRDVLSQASKLTPDDNRVFRIKNELSFVNGDWEQENNGAPLIPFDDRDTPKEKNSSSQSPLDLVSFWVTDVDQASRSKSGYSVSGMLYLGITRNGSFAGKPYEGSPQFQMWPGSSALIILFQGVYVESDENGGERVMCLLGNTVLPSRQPDSTDPWEWMKGSSSSYYQPVLLQDDQIILVLRYPKTFTLTSRGIRGEMRSINHESSLKFFDKVHISSQLGAFSNYEFGSEKLVSKACDPYPQKDDLMSNEANIYKGSAFCALLQRFAYGEAFVVPNWKCSVTDDYCSKLGPFSGKEIKSTDEGFKDVRLGIKDVRCEPRYGRRNSSSARVSALFRVVGPLESFYTAVERTGLSNATLVAEGIWNSSSGQLCMIGCLGLVKNSGSCNSRICLYIPLSFSITQRNVISGSISSIDNKTLSHFPLSFRQILQPSELYDQFETSKLSYMYSKIKFAGAFLERSEPFDFKTVIKKSFLSYPSLENGADLFVSLSLLAEDLTLHVSATSDLLPKLHSARTVIDVQILSLGPLFGRYWSSQNRSTAEEDAPFHAKAESTEKQLLLNISAQLTLKENPYNNSFKLSLEGLYDSRVGKMYLIGCRDVWKSWRTLFESHDLEDGFDCLIEVKLEYPPKTARWLVNPTAMLSISSQRNEDDPLYFSPIKCQSLPIMYRQQREDILSRRGVEGILRILTLSLAITFILSQLFYIRNKLDDVPYISLVMLGVQALGYSLPLITGVEALFKKMESESHETPSYDLETSQWFHVIDFGVKLLILVAFLLTLRLFQKVWKCRIRLLTRAPLEPGRVPSDKRVLFTSLVIHTVGFALVLIVHSLNPSKRAIQADKYIDRMGNTYKLHEWETQLEEYMGLVQDFFLLPQIIGNILWQIHCKPLRKVYYVGITLVRLLPHVYDYVRAPVSNPYFSEEYEFVNPSLDFYSRFGDVAIPLAAVVLSIVVFIQQRWSYEKLSRTINVGQHKLLPFGSKVYERLPSKSVEAELVSGVNENAADGRGEEDEK